jgi:large conductance mechanosensitive channel
MEEKNFIKSKELKKYKEFAFKEDMLKMSIAFILGNAFNKVVTGISDFLIMPLINFILTQTGESWRKWNLEPISGLKVEIGQFCGVMVDFLLISLILYIFYGKIISGMVSNKQDKRKPLYL